MRVAAVTCALVLFAAPAVAASLTEKTGVNAALGVSPSTPDFVSGAAIGGMFEIRSSELAVAKSTDAATKAFAEQMIRDHTKASAELAALATKIGGLTVPTALDAGHQSELDDLAKESGTDFDDAYADDQQDAHEDAVSLFKRYAEGGDTRS